MKKNYHEGTEYVRSLLQQNNWIIELRNSLRSVGKNCVKCGRKRQTGRVQAFMADLTRKRLEEKVFYVSNSVVDCFGPFKVKITRKLAKR